MKYKYAWIVFVQPTYAMLNLGNTEKSKQDTSLRYAAQTYGIQICRVGTAWRVK
ncbi:hypothetical protein IV72_GL000041 [Atopobium minutum]|nr:hypothetical protein IV72_GL000041 [Atopobium minutum]